MKKKFQKAIGSTILMVLVLSFIALFISRCGFALVPVPTRYAYQPILKYRWETKNIVEHFPAEIPDEAKNIKFYYREGVESSASKSLNLTGNTMRFYVKFSAGPKITHLLPDQVMFLYY